MASDLVTEMYSTTLIEALHLGKLAVSIQPNLNKQDILPTNRMGLTIPIYKAEDILPTLEKVIYGEDFKLYMKEKRKSFISDGKASERVVNLIYNTLNLSHKN